MKPLSIIVALIVLLVNINVTVARDPQFLTKNSEGKEFWLCFMKNFRDGATNDRQNAPTNLKLQLFLTSSFDANVKIEIEEINYNNTVSIKANTVVNVQLPPRTQLRGGDTPERLAVHVTADTAIAVYGLNSRYQTTETFLGLPVSVLGTSYRAVGYTKLAMDLLSAFSIIATEDDTKIEIEPTTMLSTGFGPGQVMKLTLRKGDVYTVTAKWESIGPSDLTGSKITANKKIAVFSGHNCAYVPPKVDACNHLIEQLPPITAWGKHYYLGMLRERSKYTYRVVASEDNTRVFEDAKLVAVLKAGEFYENLNVSKHIQVTADKPILVAQYSQGFKVDNVGDPMMLLVSPTQQFLNEYRFATPINGDWHHYINVVAPVGTINDIRLNGRRLDSSLFKSFGESRYVIAQIAIPYGTHVIRSEEPFGLYSYGFGFRNDAYDGYGNMTGQSFIELNKMVDSLPPMADGKISRDNFLVTFRDDRVMDKGMKAVKILTAEFLDVEVPKLEEGTPHLSVKISPAVAGRQGRVIFQAVDVAGNQSEYTLCYIFDTRSERMVYYLSEGRNAVCASDAAWIVGVYGAAVHAYHAANFTNSGNLGSKGTFGEAEGLGLGVGALIGRRILPGVILNARIQMNTIGGTLLSADSTRSTVYDEASGQFLQYYEGSLLTVTAPIVKFGLLAQWFPDRFFYVAGGANVAVTLGSSVQVQRDILTPPNWQFANGTTPLTVSPDKLTSLNTFGFELVGGVGFSYPVSLNGSVFLESLYTQRLGDVISDGAWRMGSLGLNAGFLWRF
ncbi:MAG: IgGFc-binding protein [Ignavibacteria bacterium]|nr:IgGFc-binding protein [Ignavibacteria bacterium]